MYSSLKSNSNDFHLYFFPFDEKSKTILQQLNLSHVTVVTLTEFENEHLLAVKPTRTKGEYCWTCTPSIISYCMDRFGLDQCTYIDADLYFFSNPNILVDEMQHKSVLITEHRYTRRYDKSLESGIYCVQFITFKNNTEGRTALNWWRDKCLEWCYSRIEDGKFGDQKYLDDWPERFAGVHVLKNLGGGVAPWNVQQYEIVDQDNKLFLKLNTELIMLVFYHFHYVKSYENDQVDLGNYRLSKTVLNQIYKPYLLRISEMELMLYKRFQFERQTQKYFYKYKILKPIHRLARVILNIYNVYSVKNILNGKVD
jgi:hypothetical protein